jgi:hypothetical protein
VKRNDPPTEQQEGKGQHHKLIVQRKIYEGADHFLLTIFLPIPLVRGGTGVSPVQLGGDARLSA